MHVINAVQTLTEPEMFGCRRTLSGLLIVLSS
jgi:hypothetical protein